MVNLEINLGNLSDIKQRHYAAKLFNKSYKNFKRINLRFTSEYMIQDLTIFINELSCDQFYFDHCVKISGVNRPEEVYSVANSVFSHRKHKNQHKRIKKLISIFIFIFTIIGFCVFYRIVYTKFYVPYAEINRIEGKINYLIDLYNVRPFLIQKYSKTNESLSQNMHILAKEIYKTKKIFDLPENLEIAYNFKESTCWKYAVSKTGAIGYSQVMFSVWGGDITNKRKYITNSSKLFEPEENIYWGGYILDSYRTDDDYKSLFKYNGGTFKNIKVGNKSKVIATSESFYHLKDIFNIMVQLSEYDNRNKEKIKGEQKHGKETN